MTQTFYSSIFTILTQSEQLSTFSTLQKLLEKFGNYKKKNIIFGGDFDLIFDC